jgi:small-conductance mechanosensitive channel
LLLLVFLSRLAVYIIKKGLNRYQKSSVTDGFDEVREYTVGQLAKYLIYTFTIILSIESLGLDISILIASSAALFVGIGLGLQNIFNDITSGIFLLFEQTVAVGDVVEIDDLVGKVEKINIRTSKITTRDSITIVVPNHVLIGNKVINWSTENENTRFKIPVGVAYGSDTRLVEKVLINCAIEHNKVLKFPKPIVRFMDFGNSSLDFQLLFWTKDIWLVDIIRSDLRFMIDQAFRENNISIPFPQRDLHIKSGFKD